MSDRPLIYMMSVGSSCSSDGSMVSFRDPFEDFRLSSIFDTAGHLAVSVWILLVVLTGSRSALIMSAGLSKFKIRFLRPYDG